jgi:hypothetical protein
MNKCFKSLICLFLATITTTIWAPNGHLPKKPTTPVKKTKKQPQHIPTFEPRALFIVLDDSEANESHYGAISQDFEAMFNQKVCPLLVSSSLFMTNIDKLHDIDTWLIKEVNTRLYLLIPRKYLTNLSIEYSAAANYTQEQSLLKDELKLGLKINHMKTVALKTLIKSSPSEKLPKYTDYFMPAVYHQDEKKDEKSDIFCLRTDYYQNKVSTQPNWSIYMLGHGEMKDFIVGLTLADFKLFLTFLTNKINTRLFVYLSCYAAGYNTKIIYEEFGKVLQQTYPFTIITQALGDVSTTNAPSALKFDLFFNEITAPEIIDYEKAMDALNTKEALNREDQEYYEQYSVAPRENLSWENVPQIKYPGLSWFSPMTNRRNAVSIGSILAKTRGANRPLDIATFFGKNTDPRALLIYAADIPFEIKINSLRFDAIISMIPGDAIHKFEKISSTTKTIDEITGTFLKLNRLEPLKLFFIKEVSAKMKNSTQFATYKNVIIYSSYDNIYFEVLQYEFYEHNGTLYVRNTSYPEDQSNDIQKFTFRECQNDDLDAKEYHELMCLLNYKILPLPSLQITSPEDFMAQLPEFQNNIIYHIEHVSSKKPGLTLADLTTALQKKLNETKKDCFVRIDSLDLIVTSPDLLKLYNVIITDKDMYYQDEHDNQYQNGTIINYDYLTMFTPLQKEGALLPVTITHENIGTINKIMEQHAQSPSHKK